MANFPSSYIQTVGSTVTRSAEQLSFPFTAKPQAMTVYVKFIERGTILAPSNTRIINIGASADTTPQLLIRVLTGLYNVFHDNGTSSVNSSLAAASTLGDLVELRLVIFGDGAVQIHQSVNSAAETSSTKSAALALATAWSGQLISLNSVGSTQVGFNAFISVKIDTGEQSLTTMRQLRTAMGSGP